MTQTQIDSFFDKLTLADDFVFKMVLENEGICKKLIEMVLGKKVARIVSLETEKPLSEGFFSHSVRFDVYVEGSSEVIDFEVQCSPVKDIAKRMREYQANLDVEQLRKGKPYSDLKESWIVFFCTFDPFKLGLPVYIVEQVFKDTHGAKYDDGTHKVLYNCPAWEKCSDKEMQAFLKLFLGLEAETEYTRQIVHEIHTSLKREDVRRRVMRLQDIVYQRAEQMFNQQTEQFIEERVEERLKESKMLWFANGEERGEKQGFDRGSRQKALQTARNLIAMGLDADQIAQATGLSIEDVRELM